MNSSKRFLMTAKQGEGEGKLVMRIGLFGSDANRLAKTFFRLFEIAGGAVGHAIIEMIFPGPGFAQKIEHMDSRLIF